MLTLSNSTLIDKVNFDERKGFALIYQQYWEDLYRFIIRILPDEDETKDVVQQSFISLWEARERISELKSIKAFLFVIARNIAFKQLKIKLRHNEFIDEYVHYFAEVSNALEAHLDTKDLKTLLQEEINRLPEKMREVFILSREEHLSYKEIAERLNISDKTVKKQISNALKLLRCKVDSEYMPYLLVILIADLYC